MEMFMAQLMPLIYALVSPFVTELAKAGAQQVIGSVPKNAVPMIGAAAGAAVGALAQAVDPSLPITVASGTLAGLAGTGIHQAVYGKRYQRVE